MKKIFDFCVKYMILCFVFLLPFHAVIITILQCKLDIPTGILRFWKEGVILLLLAIVSIKLLLKHKSNIGMLLKNNSLVGLIIVFIFSSLLYTFYPYLTIKTHAILGFKYDVFFLFTLLIGLYLFEIRHYFKTILITLFTSTLLVLVLFLPTYMTGNISKKAEMLGYSNKVSTYEAGGCLAFAQNVTGGHNRLQASFGDPIRFSVFLVIVYFLFLGYMLEYRKEKIQTYAIIAGVSGITFLAIFYAFTKTSILGLLFGGIIFIYFVRKLKFAKSLSRRFIAFSGISFGIVLTFLLYIKRDLFLHPEAILGRFENLIISVKMFLWNPLGYGLGVAGPASQLATSSDKALSDGVQKFLPENWYVQIFLEQGFVGGIIFLSIIIIIAMHLYAIMMRKKDYFSIAIFTAFLSLAFMANFTHVFEESATNFILFLVIGAYIAKEAKGFKY